MLKGRATSAGLRWLLSIAALSLAGGCAPRAGEGPSRDTLPGLIAAHNARVEQLQQIAATGVIEYRWLDADGDRHVEPQIDVRLYFDMPRKTALRGQKLGETLFWLGSDDERYWYFDLHDSPRRLIVARHDAPTPRELPIGLAPLALVDLIGLTPLAVENVVESAQYDTASRAWAIESTGAGGPVRLMMDSETGLPVRVEAFSPEGEVVLTSAIRRYRSVPVEGASYAALPRVPTLVDIDDRDGRVSIKLALDRPSKEWVIVPENAFVLPALIEALRPDVIEGEAALHGAVNDDPVRPESAAVPEPARQTPKP